MSGLLGIEHLERPAIQAILDRAKDFQPLQNESFKRLDILRGRMVVNLFFEASTRTRTSFEIAAKRLGADAISITASGSSVSKGESLVDTLNTLARHAPGRHHHAARRIGGPAFSGAPSSHADYQCRRRHARASHPSAARRPNHPRPPFDAGRAARRDHRRYRAQPGGALQPVPAFEVRRPRGAVRPGFPACRASWRSWRPGSN